MSAPDFGTDPEQAERGLPDWARTVHDKAQRMTAMRQQIDAIRVTETNRRGTVTITVDSRGVLTDIQFSDRSRELPGTQLLMEVLQCAQAGIADRVAEATRSTVGSEDPG